MTVHLPRSRRKRGAQRRNTVAAAAGAGDARPMREPAVRLVPWSAEDLPLLRRINTPEMRQHVGGPETDEQTVARHQRYLALEAGRMFRIELAGGEAAGSIAFWSRIWHRAPVYES